MLLTARLRLALAAAAVGSACALQVPGAPHHACAPPAAHASPAPSLLPSRRGTLAGGLLGAASAALGALAPASASMEGTNWPLYLALPLAPYSRRKTILREAVAGQVWTFDQMLGTLYVHVPIRMTVVAMEQGGVFVYAPVAPTDECLRLLQPIVDAHGPVKHIVLPSVAPEHKVLAGPFAKQFPRAEFWLTDQQYAFPLNLPRRWLGLPRSAKPLPKSSKGLDLWGGEFEHEVLTAKASARSVYQDAAFYHKPSKSLLLCDALQSISASPPDILLSEPEYRRALLYHARDSPLEKVSDDATTWAKGWQRIALFANFFMPATLVALENDAWLSAAPKSPMPELGWAGILPFTWTRKTPEAFEALSRGGELGIAPIIQIIFSREPEAAKAWLERIYAWDFERVLPCHFDAPVEASPATVRKAFAFLEKGTNEVPYCDGDVQFLRDALADLSASSPDLALFPTPLGELRGKACQLD